MSSASSSFDVKEQVKRAVDIVDLVGDYIALRRDGRGYKGLCPWHDDSRPSLQVNPQRQSFKCWVCDLGGDVFSFVMKMENVEFREALELLAQRAGIALPKAGKAAAPGAVDEKQLLYDCLAWAEQQFHDFLQQSPEAEVARKYLRERGIAEEYVSRFRLGFAPDRWDWLLSKSQSTRFRPPLLEKAGLAIRRERDGGLYDRFRGRLLFSIRDPQGRPVGTGGRLLPGIGNQEMAKYINSPETPLFSKSSMLYGLDQAKEAVSRTKTALVMEGYTDCVLAHQFGFPHAVAVLGTALGQRHIRLLKRYADTVVLVLDGDEAGQKRTNEVLGLFLQEQVDLRVLSLPDELDPADFLLARGAEAFAEQLASPRDALEHKLQTALAGLTHASSIHQAQLAVEDVLGTLALAPRPTSGTTGPHAVKEDQVLHRLAHRFGIAEETLRSRLRELRGQAQRRTESAAPAATATRHKLPLGERLLWEIVLEQPDWFVEVAAAVGPEQLEAAASRQLWQLCQEIVAAGGVCSYDRLMLETEDQRLKSLLVELAEERQQRPGNDLRSEFESLLASFRKTLAQEESRRRRVAIAESHRSPEEQLQLLQEALSALKSGTPPQKE